MRPIYTRVRFHVEMPRSYLKKNDSILKMKQLNVKSASEIGRAKEPLFHFATQLFSLNELMQMPFKRGKLPREADMKLILELN